MNSLCGTYILPGVDFVCVCVLIMPVADPPLLSPSSGSGYLIKSAANRNNASAVSPNTSHPSPRYANTVSATGGGFGNNKMAESAIGIYDGAFFVPKTQLIDWVNRLLRTSVQKIEECANGALYCQIIDSLYPGKVHVRKLNWAAKLEHEFVKLPRPYPFMWSYVD